MKTLAEVAERVNIKIQNDLAEGKIYKGTKSVEFEHRSFWAKVKMQTDISISNKSYTWTITTSMSKN